MRPPPLPTLSQDGFTPLMLASAGGSESCTRALLDAGASKDLKTRDGKTAAALAFERQREEVATSGGMAKDYALVLSALGAVSEGLPAAGPAAIAPPGPAVDALRKQLEAVEREKAALNAELDKARAEARKHQQALELSQSEKDALAKAKEDALVRLRACGRAATITPSQDIASHACVPRTKSISLRARP